MDILVDLEVFAVAMLNGVDGTLSRGRMKAGVKCLRSVLKMGSVLLEETGDGWGWGWEEKSTWMDVGFWELLLRS